MNGSNPISALEREKKWAEFLEVFVDKTATRLGLERWVVFRMAYLALCVVKKTEGRAGSHVVVVPVDTLVRLEHERTMPPVTSFNNELVLPAGCEVGDFPYPIDPSIDVLLVMWVTKGSTIEKMDGDWCVMRLPRTLFCDALEPLELTYTLLALREVMLSNPVL